METQRETPQHPWMDAATVRQAFLEYYRARGHAVIGGAPLVPRADPSVLFTTAGMHPLVPFLLGRPHPAGTRLTNYQKCLRTNDIEEVGDGKHLTFFEMLGAWSLDDYGKPQALAWTYAFLTDRLGLDPGRFHVTCFAGDADAPRDDEAAATWRGLGIPPERITFLAKADNWWGPAGTSGPCGPDSELFYDLQPGGPADETPGSHPGRFWEVCNNVFLQYDQQTDGQIQPLAQPNIDMGLGLERVLPLVQGVGSIYETDLFVPLVEAIRRQARDPRPFAVQVIADHVRAAVAILADGVAPGKVGQPYIARRLIRRAVRYGREIGMPGPFLAGLAGPVIATLGAAYPELAAEHDRVRAALEAEETRFGRTLAAGEKEFARTVAACRTRGMSEITGQDAFRLYSTFGFPVELTQEMARIQGLGVDLAGFGAAFAQHQALSREGAAPRFRGGPLDAPIGRLGTG